MPFCVKVRFAASRFYRFFEYELSIFIACRAFPQGRKMQETQWLRRLLMRRAGVSNDRTFTPRVPV